MCITACPPVDDAYTDIVARILDASVIRDDPCTVDDAAALLRFPALHTPSWAAARVYTFVPDGPTYRWYKAGTTVAKALAGFGAAGYGMARLVRLPPRPPPPRGPVAHARVV